MTFRLFGLPEAELRLKSFSSSSRGTRMTIRIEVETSDPFEFGYALRNLAEVQKGQRAKPKKTKPTPKPKVKPLALPAPQLALPKPEGL
ncbi:hypothetical protein [Paracoccus denitrificans]|uniref:hypothetical protein n=1 Tax=Paracoccus denitrificans TaxID=266 RepID=UPI003364F5CD